MREIIIQKIKDRIIYHSDEKKHRFEIGKGVIDKCAEDIIDDIGIDELERLAEIGKATEKAYQEGYIVAEVEQIADPFNENALRIVCHHAFGTIEGLVTILKWGKEVE